MPSATDTHRTPRIFISYRRDDSAGYAGRLYDRLVERFGSDGVFMDIDAIQPSHKFADDIEEALADCDACIVLIGRRWTSIESIDGRRRLDDPTDFIRLEVGAAIRRGIPVFPVLVEGAAPPITALLPDDIRELSARQAIELSSERWNYDVGRLMLALSDALGVTPKRHRAPARWSPVVVAAVILVLAIAGIGAWILSRSEASCQGAQLCGTYRVNMSLTALSGADGVNITLWGVKDPHEGAAEKAWMDQIWVFGPPGPNSWLIPLRPTLAGTLESDRSYTSTGNSGCLGGDDAPVHRRLVVVPSDPDSEPPASVFRGTLRIEWDCAGSEPVEATFQVAGTMKAA